MDVRPRAKIQHTKREISFRSKGKISIKINVARTFGSSFQTLNMYYKKKITENVLKDSMKSMIMLAWYIFFSEMCNEADKFIDEESMEQEYQNFIEELHSYFPKDYDTFEKILSNFTATYSLNMIEQLSGKIM